MNSSVAKGFNSVILTLQRLGSPSARSASSQWQDGSPACHVPRRLPFRTWAAMIRVASLSEGGVGRERPSSRAP